MAPLGVRFHGTAEVWDSVADPDSGLVTLGVPLWSGHTSKDAADDTPSLLYAVGQHAFVLAKCLDKLEQNYLDALAKLRDVLRHAPQGRDVHSSVERTLRLCIVPKLTHFARAFPPSLVRDALKRCDDATVQFVVTDLYQ